MSRHQPNSKRVSDCGFSFSALSLLLLTCVFAHAQGGGIDTAGTGGRHSINGRLLAPSGQRADLRLKIRLESTGAGDLSVLSDMNGNFSFQSLRPGNYTVVIEGGEFFETVRESVFIESATVSGRRVGGYVPLSRPFTMQVYLRPKQQANATRTGVLDASMASVPKTAQDYYYKAVESARLGDNQKAVELLKQALALYPSFALALNELGEQYLKLGQIDRAAEPLQRAVSLSPDAYEPSLNYGFVLLNQMKFVDAERYLRAALRQNETAFAPHLYLGMALVNLKDYQEAEIELKKAISLGGDKAAQAHYYLGGLYWRARNYDQAANELEKYLHLEPKAANAERIRNTIKDLRKKT